MVARKALMSPLVALGRAIQDLRKLHGFSQSQLAQKLGVSQAMLSFHESGRHDMPVTRFLTICRVLNITPSSLMKQVEQKTHYI